MIRSISTMSASAAPMTGSTPLNGLSFQQMLMGAFPDSKLEGAITESTKLPEFTDNQMIPQVTEEDLLLLLDGLQKHIHTLLKEGSPEEDKLDELEKLAAELFVLLTQENAPPLKVTVRLQQNGAIHRQNHFSEWLTPVRAGQLFEVLTSLEKEGQLPAGLKALLTSLTEKKNGPDTAAAFMQSALKKPLPTHQQSAPSAADIVSSNISKAYQLSAAAVKSVQLSTAANTGVQLSSTIDKTIPISNETLNFNTQSPLPKSEQLLLFIKTDSTGSRVNQEDMIQQIQQILSKSKFVTVNGSEKLFLKLYPEHLGELRIEIMQSDGKWTAKFTAGSLMVKEVIESHLHQLKQGLTAQHIQMEKIEVLHSFTSSSRDFAQEQGERGRHGEQSNRENQRKESMERSFEDSLNEELNNE
ncbi:flagellar hook-length control protein FliK [Metabacillus sp. KIGAM252]|uniref:Flagellar hook-length control protein FliK n=1 Tax=Metabacillus flavus TaxID=2823519 RepID=A0ABS5LE36_9BACI|nr:flagellar hook-length control protein FliK [Metabacillus flavus]MBS2968987.1 flagellar hook-length control protein FliK [Metabacillus flavus]